MVNPIPRYRIYASKMEQLQPITESTVRADFEGCCERQHHTYNGHWLILEEATFYPFFLSSRQIQPF